LMTYTLNDAHGDCDIYLGFGLYPNKTYYIAANESLEDSSTIVYSAIDSGDYYLGVFGFWGCQFNLTLNLLTNGSSSGCNSTTKCSMHGTCPSNSQGICSCNFGYTGDNCETAIYPLIPLLPTHGYVFDNTWNYYHVRLYTASSLIIQVNQTAGQASADCDLYIKEGEAPTYYSYDYVKLSTDQLFNITIPNPLNTTWYIGVFGWSTCEYDIVAFSSTSCPYNCSGHGVCSGNGVCICNSGWSGSACSLQATTLTNGAVAYGLVTFNQWSYYSIAVSNAYEVDIHLKELGNYTESGFLWVYESSTGFPNLRTYDFSDTSMDDKLHSLKVTFANPPVTRQIFIGVYGSPILHERSTVSFAIVAWYPPFW